MVIRNASVFFLEASVKNSLNVVVTYIPSQYRILKCECQQTKLNDAI